MTFSPEEKWEMVKLYLMGNSFREAARKFAETHPDRGEQPSHVTVKTCFDIMERFQCLRTEHSKKTRPNAQISEEEKLLVCTAVEEDASRSVREIAKITECGKSSIHRILKDNKYHPYKVQYHQEIFDHDMIHRLEFCREIGAMIQREPDLPRRIIFTDESTFLLKHRPNRQNCRRWAIRNPHTSVPVNSQHQLKLNVWCGLVGDNLIGPFFIEGNLNGDKYLDLLQECIGPALEALNINDQLYWQQDGAPPHSSRRVTEFLNRHWGNNWIGRYGPIAWPARSPDLTPMDYFLWGHIKNQIYDGSTIDSLDELKALITSVAASITIEEIRNTQMEFVNRIATCREMRGDIFENIL